MQCIRTYFRAAKAAAPESRSFTTIFSRFIATLALTLCTSVAAQSTDVLSWFNSQLPANQFIGYVGQRLDHTTGAWSLFAATRDLNPNGPIIHVYQPMLSRVNREGRQIYWRKDDFRNLASDWNGEILYYDNQHIYLWSETAPWSIHEGDPYWDQRPERFRLFRAAHDMSKGRIWAPLTFSPSWSFSGYLNTELCGITALGQGKQNVDGWVQSSNNSCIRYQSGVHDALVNMEIRYNVDLHDLPGMKTNMAGVEYPVGSSYVRRLPRVWDALLIINQHMTWGTGLSRERFIMGYHQGMYYGIVAWDDATGPDRNNMTVHTRAIPEAVFSRDAGPMTFDGMVRRSAHDRSKPPPSKPKNLSVRCISRSNKAMLSWDPVPGQTGSDIRIDDSSDSWQPFSSRNDVVVNGHKGNSYIFDTRPGRTYSWWVHASNESGSTDAAAATGTFPACTGSGAIIPGVPVNPRAQIVNDVAILSWEPNLNATGYDIRIDDMTDAWLPSTGNNDVVIDDFKGASYIFKMIPGRTYRWWVHARNSAGASGAVHGPSVAYARP